MSSVITREKRALLSLRGLSVGDAFGECYFMLPGVVDGMIARRALRPAPWRYTDDTMMALSVYEVLRKYGTINQDALARSFARRYDCSRGYGPAMHGLLAQIDAGEPWQSAAGSLFGGTGSFGNGSAMRVAPLGAYFADEPERIPLEAEYSAAVTHAHPEAVAGAIAVAAATAMAMDHPHLSWREFLQKVLAQVPDSEVHTGIRQASELREETTPRHAAAMLGSGSRVSCQDTVPFSLWCAARHRDDFAEALWATVSGLGDRDTTCAIVGGIVACAAPVETIPDAWLEATESLPLWAICDI